MALTVAVVDAIRARLAAVPAKESSAHEVTRVEAVTRMRGEILALRERGYSWEEVAAMASKEGCRVAAATLRTSFREGAPPPRARTPNRRARRRMWRMWRTPRCTSAAMFRPCHVTREGERAAA